jgi:hypothetical protein
LWDIAKNCSAFAQTESDREPWMNRNELRKAGINLMVVF